MAKIALTAPRVAGFSCPPDKAQAFLWDSKAPGLGLRATPRGVPAFIFQSVYQGKSLRITIGDAQAWRIPDAQAKARELQRHIDEGRDPRAVKAEAAAKDVAARVAQRRESALMSEAWAEYIKRGKPKKKAAWKPRYLADMQKMASLGGEPKKRGKGLTLPGPIAPLLDMRLKDLTPRALRAWHAKEAQRGEAQAARAVQIVSGFLRWCGTEDAYEGLVDPLAARDPKVQDQLPSAAGNRRTDALEEGQLMAWFVGVAQLRNRTAAAYLQGLLLTGARREELAALKWSDIDFRWGRLTIADKVGDTRSLPLAPYLQHLLQGLPRIDKNPHVFASAIAIKGRIADPRSAHTEALAHEGLPHVTIHGLRRTFALMGEAAGCPAGAIAQIMGHRPGSMSEKYKPRTIEQLRTYMAQVERFIVTKAGIQFDFDAGQEERHGDVVQFTRKAA
ncbi:integrase [Variovorax sp. WS11]|uniref:site-specific integrase n=1 Tax=Variovorax sp. WS11 TaxID=1105204 RepID=UPI000D0CADB5|nr:site-specific integrase [Variovorax sp. WS11]NDZ15560.1 site-specific integrase [Variovorax sp. WS11]PSL83328.1 integrase [Variovorax sp. WS11]